MAKRDLTPKEVKKLAIGMLSGHLLKKDWCGVEEMDTDILLIKYISEQAIARALMKHVGISGQDAYRLTQDIDEVAEVILAHGLRDE